MVRPSDREPLLEDVAVVPGFSYSPATLNPYHFSGNTPTTYVDPTGQFLVWGCAIGGFIGAVGGLFGGGLVSARTCCPGDTECALRNLLVSVLGSAMMGCLTGAFMEITTTSLLIEIFGFRIVSAGVALAAGAAFPPDCGCKSMNGSGGPTSGIRH